MNQDLNANSQTGPDHPNVLVPPPIIFLAVLALGVVIELFAMGVYAQPGWVLTVLVYAGGLSVLAGLVFGAAAFYEMRRADTNVLPTKPAKALVTDGIYRISRNPIYVGMILITAGISLILNAPVMLLLLWVGTVVLRVGVVNREEQYLDGKFPEYRDYKDSVGRWFWGF